MAYQVVEKGSIATDWGLVRYNEKALARFENQADAIKAATEYLTDKNCNNALTADEKALHFEYYMLTEQGAFLGILDGKPWFLTYPKDIVGKKDGEVVTLHAKGEPVKDPEFQMLEDKTVVAVRVLPGSDK